MDRFLCFKRLATTALFAGILSAVYCHYNTELQVVSSLSGPETALWDRLIPIRMLLYGISALFGLTAWVLALFRRRLALGFWLAAILSAVAIFLIPTYPVPAPLPLARAVALFGILAQIALWAAAYRRCQPKAR